VLVLLRERLQRAPLRVHALLDKCCARAELLLGERAAFVTEVLVVVLRRQPLPSRQGLATPSLLNSDTTRSLFSFVVRSFEG
jgi:hypothetical protein